VDTAPDLAYALNLLRQQYGLPALAYEKIRPLVSRGGGALITLGFGVQDTDPEFTALGNKFLDLYRRHLHRSAALFPGMAAVIDALEEQSYRWGIVTNKPAWLTAPLMDAIGLEKRAACIICGDSLPYRKPHPQPLLHACRLIGASPHESAYIGDAKRDIEAGRNAGMSTLLAAYGYIDEGESPETWGADRIINTPAEILEWFHQPPRRP